MLVFCVEERFDGTTGGYNNTHRTNMTTITDTKRQTLLFPRIIRQRTPHGLDTSAFAYRLYEILDLLKYAMGNFH